MKTIGVNLSPAESAGTASVRREMDFKNVPRRSVLFHLPRPPAIGRQSGKQTVSGATWIITSFAAGGLIEYYTHVSYTMGWPDFNTLVAILGKFFGATALRRMASGRDAIPRRVDGSHGYCDIIAL